MAEIDVRFKAKIIVATETTEVTAFQRFSFFESIFEIQLRLR